MGSATTSSSSVPSPASNLAPRSIPSLDELYQLTTEPDDRIVIRGVDWAYYDQLVDSIPEGANLHVDYDGKDLEIMTLSLLHDDVKGLLGRIVEVVAEECEIPLKSAGQTTWKRPEIARGLEADESYFFRPEKLVAVARAKAKIQADRRLPESRPRNRSRYFSIEDRPTGDLLRTPGRRGLAIRRRNGASRHRAIG